MTRHRLTAFAALLPAFLLLAACSAGPPADPIQAAAWEHGIELLGVQITAGGDLARVNYRVVDIEKAKRAFHSGVRLIAADGERPLGVLSVGRLGPMRQRPSATGKQQFIMFTNPGRILQKGGTVTLAIGESRIPGVPVT